MSEVEDMADLKDSSPLFGDLDKKIFFLRINVADIDKLFTFIWRS